MDVVAKWVALVGVVVGVVACGEASGVVQGVEDATPWLEPETGLAVQDGDVLAGPAEAGTASGGLTVARVNGHDDVWPAAARQRLTWCLDEASFGDAAVAVTRAMEQATADWEASANVRFVHVPSADRRCSRATSDVVFDVRQVTGRPYLARSFFPSQPRSARELLVDATALPPPAPITLAGVLRHELGHVLGLRHEHTRLTSNPCYEDAQWRAVTPYDVRSVMHYPQCNGVSDHDLVLTARDKQGIATLYP